MKIYNTLTRTKEEFKTIEENKVRIYVCGPTVYDLIHIGNARPMIVFDTFRRYLLFLGYEVCFVSNFTDIDDKIINRVNELNTTSSELSQKYISECKKDMSDMNIMKATYNPLATEEINEMIHFIDELIKKGYAYKVPNGTVYFDTSKSKEYGKLSHKNIDELVSGLRELKVTGEDDKKNFSDFVLWKPKKEGEPYWESPFCDGRPGWHTECCVMAPKYCNGNLDIHAGGEDLIFPHHENEIAQYESLHEGNYANYWMHNAFLNINNKKMSKSLNNFLTVRDILSKINGSELRLLMLSTHYRMMLNFSLTDDNSNSLKLAKSSYERISNCIKNLKFILTKINLQIADDVIDTKKELDEYLADIKTCDEFSAEEKNTINQAIEYVDKYFEKLNDDFNTSDAITQIYEIVRLANQTVNEQSNQIYILFFYQILMCLISIFGLKINNDEVLDEDIEKLIEERNEARKNKDFNRADEIRQELLNKGIELEDTRQGVKWKRI